MRSAASLPRSAIYVRAHPPVAGIHARHLPQVLAARLSYCEDHVCRHPWRHYVRLHVPIPRGLRPDPTL